MLRTGGLAGPLTTAAASLAEQVADHVLDTLARPLLLLAQPVPACRVPRSVSPSPETRLMRQVFIGVALVVAGIAAFIEAHSAGLTLGGYVRIEQAKASPGWGTVRRLAEALGVSLDELGRQVEAEE